MAKYGRRYSKRRKFYRKRPYGRKSGGLRGQVRSIARKVRNIRKTVETKYTESNYVGVATVTQSTLTPTFPNTYAFWCLNPIGQGAGITNREGLQIKPTSLGIHLVVNTEDTTGQYQRFRVVVFRDKMYDGTTGNLPSLEKLFTTASGVGGQLTFNNWTFRKRFEIIKQKFYNLYNYQYYQGDQQTGDLITPSTKVKWLRWNLKLRGKKINFVGTTGDISSCGQGSLFLLVQGYNTLGHESTNVMNASVTWRLYFQG